MISLASASPKPLQRAPLSLAARKVDGFRESSPRQNRQGEREEKISVAPSDPSIAAGARGRSVGASGKQARPIAFAKNWRRE